MLKRSFKIYVLALCLMVMGAQSAVACPPQDEALQNIRFAYFRSFFLGVVGSKDVRLLKRVVAPDIRFGFGSEQGWDAFAKRWKLDSDPQRSLLWANLADTLALGGNFTDAKTFVAPYVFNCDGVKDPYTEALVMGSKVSLRAEPNNKARILERVSHEWVTTLDGGKSDDTAWRKVKTRTGKVGYINGIYVRKAIDYRAFFSPNKKGEWKLKLFLAGD